MTVKLTSQATGDLPLVNALAHELLGLLGKQADQPGILEPADMPHALGVLRGLPADSPQSRADTQAPDEAEEEGDLAVPFAEETVPLRKRAWPLIQMIERALAEGKPIVWGV